MVKAADPLLVTSQIMDVEAFIVVVMVGTII